MNKFKQDLRLLWMVLLAMACTLAGNAQNNQVKIADEKIAWPVLIEENASKSIQVSAKHFADDIKMITGIGPEIIGKTGKLPKKLILVGSLENSALIKKMVSTGKIKPGAGAKAWDGFLVQMVANPFAGVEMALVVTGAQNRGVSYGLFHLSEMFGVSPWYWWADVPVKKAPEIILPSNYFFEDFPRVKYRGIFINDEAPALSNWSKEKFGGFNHQFYEKVFELMLRLKANYIWPAMWGNAFYDDDSLNIQSAKDYGVVIGTSHHEPLMRAHDEWRRYGKGKWNYDSNELKLKEFWKSGMQRATNEKIVTVGMRGDGDEPMSRETATSLLERIVTDQRKIITEVSEKPADQTPQLWALYKEVQDYYDKGMRVPDDVTLLLCDDNWGNIRRLPAINEKPRKGGYGIYYHFDYVGGPRNYKWINTNHITRIWEQMHLAYQYKAKEIWIVNVGDIKPMEFPISFFLDYAWNPEKTGADDLKEYTRNWVAKQFGTTHANDIEDILNKYTKFNSRRKPELLDARTFSVETGEWNRVTEEYQNLYRKADAIRNALPESFQDAYFQLVLHPVRASANLYGMYHAVAMNQFFAQRGDTAANGFARKARQYYLNDSSISVIYHKINNGKWNHMMSQTHIGYTYWQQPPVNRMPATEMVPMFNLNEPLYRNQTPGISAKEKIPADAKGNLFFEKDGYAFIQANHFTRKQESRNISWKILPDHGRTGDAITTWPVTEVPGGTVDASPWLEYDLYTYSKDTLQLQFWFSPTLNFQHAPEGLQFEVTLNGGQPIIFSINKKDNDTRTWEGWVASNIIKISSRHSLLQQGKQTIRYRPLHPGMVLQNIVANMGGLQHSYLGTEETIIQK